MSPRFPKRRSVVLTAGMAALATVSQLASVFAVEGQPTEITASTADTGVVDSDHDGDADYARYGTTNRALSVGEQGGERRDLRYVAPFTLPADALTALANGAHASLRYRVWRVDNLGARTLALFGLAGGLQGLADYGRSGVPIADTVPVPGGAGVDVTSFLSEATTSTVTFRFQLDTPGAGDGKATQVNIATAEANDAENRPTLVITAPPASTIPPTTTTTTAPPATTTIPPTTTTIPATTTTAPPATTTTTTTTTTAPPTTTTTTAPSSPPVTTPPGWSLAWGDEFDGTSLDTTGWTPEHSTYGDGNNELACLTPRPENLTVADGVLTIRARKESTPYPCPGEKRSEFLAAGGRTYTSAMIRTRYKHAWTYGRFEMRAKLPTARGTTQGLWPAFWMLSNTYQYGGNGKSGELDIMEAIGSSASGTEWNRSHHTIWWDYSLGSNGRRAFTYSWPGGAMPSDGFHEYAVEWEYGEIRWYVDDVLVARSNQSTYPWVPPSGATWPAPFDHPHYLILNMAVGGNWPGAPDASTVFPAEYAIDYVRVYQR